MLGNTELTDKQRLFCIYYIEHFNATKAYKEVYGCDYKTAKREGHRLRQIPTIKQEVARLTEKVLSEAEIEKSLLNKRLFEKYIDIAFSDIGDYLSFRRKKELKWTKNKDGENIPVIDPTTGGQAFYEYNIIELKDSDEVDTSLLSEISEGKDGIRIKLSDKMKALEFLNKNWGLATEEQKLRVEKLKLEVNALSGDDEEVESDGFIEALEGKVDKVWED